MEHSRAEALEMARRAAAWVASPEGQEALARSLEQAQAATRTLTEVRRVDWRRLHEPTTI